MTLLERGFSTIQGMIDERQLMYFQSISNHCNNVNMYRRHTRRIECTFDPNLMDKDLHKKIFSLLPLHKDICLRSMGLISSDGPSEAQPWHRDRVLTDGEYSYNVIFPVDSMSEEAGFTELIPESHSRGRYCHLFKPEAQCGARKICPLLSPGDVLIADQTLLHRGGANRTAHCRRLFFLNYSTTYDTNNYSDRYRIQSR
jgi:ectoine hydroxylase-related dioxygenase (phytanoyl-CoA dioxygenase family)